jgi:hypothetical protein
VYTRDYTILDCTILSNIQYINLEKEIGEVLEKGQVRGTRNRRSCMRSLMTVKEAKGVCKDCSNWKDVISAYPKGKRV